MITIVQNVLLPLPQLFK